MKPALGRGYSVPGDDGITVVVKILRSLTLPLDDNNYFSVIQSEAKNLVRKPTFHPNITAGI